MARNVGIMEYGANVADCNIRTVAWYTKAVRYSLSSFEKRDSTRMAIVSETRNSNNAASVHSRRHVGGCFDTINEFNCFWSLLK
jgi:hypothetical protein